MVPFASPAEHLQAELAVLDLRLHAEVMRLRAARLMHDEEFRGLYITDAQIDELLKSANPPADRTVESLLATAEELRRAARARAHLGLPLVQLWSAFHLTEFEAGALLIAIAADLDLRYETLFSYAQNDVTRKRPLVDLTLKLFCSSFEDRLIARASFDARSPLVRNRLLRLVDDPQDHDPPLAARYLAADRRVVDFVIGESGIDERLAAFTSLAPAEPPGPADAASEHMAATARRRPEGLVFLLHGPSGTGKRNSASWVARSLGRRLLVADLRIALAGDGVSWPLLRREACLQNACIYLAHWEALLASEPSGSSRAAVVERELALEGRPLFLGAEEVWHPGDLWPQACSLAYQFRRPALAERRTAWQQVLNGADSGHIDLQALAARFSLSAGQMRQAFEEAQLRAGEAPVRTADLQGAARAQAGGGLGRLARCLEGRQTWDDLVLPPRQTQQLQEIVRTMRHRDHVFGAWGFDQKLPYGRGIGVLFAGPSGTGKTMAATILARELDLDLYQVDLSSVVSKYIGETEKNLSRIFQAAQTGNAILFFDEADALFGKRSEVKDAHDRYANIEIAYLLQRLEQYEGILILSTNLSKNLDEGFARRLQHTVEFPFPDARHRERIWRKAFPAGAPLDRKLDLTFMANQFELAGGNIRNIALAAAFLAAEQNSSIQMEHVILSTERELHKIGRLPSKGAFGAYWEALRCKS